MSDNTLNPMESKNIKDYLHLYLGCEAMHGNQKIVVCGLNINSHYIQNILNEDTLLIEDIKPILRPLSDMTEEEGAEIMTMIWGVADSCKYRLERKTHYIKLWQNHHVCQTTIDLASGDVDSYLEDDIQTGTRQHEITRYLLSRGFDLFGLIDAGLAIKKSH